MNRTPARGFTLTELMVAMVIGGLGTLFLVGFYLNSQAMWIEASTQALAQRDATLVLETITDRARGAASAEIFDSPDVQHQGVILRDPFLTELGRFWWDATDSLIHYSDGSNPADRGPVAPSRVARFTLAANDSLLYLTSLHVRSANGRNVEITSAIGLYNQ